MMQRILAGFTTLPGANQAYIISKKNGLLASVGNKGKSPNVEYAGKIVQAMERLGKDTSIGRGLELWHEGKNMLLLTRLSEDASLIISGKNGRLARWRHAVECDVDMLNSLIR
tara:strand:+ start:25268 stop:25606 length:339 start_codon:yes stop_codon:yes gene_type:complete